jgi:hypothetical protein
MKTRKDSRPPLVADTVQVGSGMTLAGKRYIVAEMQYYTESYDSLMVKLQLVPYDKVDPILYYFDPPVIKAKRKRSKSKKK